MFVDDSNNNAHVKNSLEDNVQIQKKKQTSLEWGNKKCQTSRTETNV